MRNDFESNYLEHSILKGFKRKNHKYFERIERNGRYIYFYTQAAYDAFMRKASGAASSIKNSLTSNSKKQTQNKEIVSNLQKKNQAASVKNSLSTGQARVEQLKQKNFSAPGKTTEEKKKNTEEAIKVGEEKIKEQIAKSSKEDSKSSKKKGSGSSSSKSSSGKSSGKSSKSSGSKKGSSSAKEKSSGSSKAVSSKTTAEKSQATTQNQTTKTQEQTKNNNEKITLDTLKKVYGKKDEDVETHKMTEAEFENKMLSKYEEGSFGYLMAGNKAYKWTIEGGKLILKDYNTEKEVSTKKYLANVKEFKEFQTNKKKTK